MEIGALPRSDGGLHVTVAVVPDTLARTDCGAPGARRTGFGCADDDGDGLGLDDGDGLGDAEGVGEGDGDAVGDGLGAGAEPTGTKVATALRAALIETVQVVDDPLHAPVQPAKSAAGFGTASRVTVCVVG